MPDSWGAVFSCGEGVRKYTFFHPTHIWVTRPQWLKILGSALVSSRIADWRAWGDNQSLCPTQTVLNFVQCGGLICGGFHLWSLVSHNTKTTPVSCCLRQKRGGFSYHTILNPANFVTPEYKMSYIIIKFFCEYNR